MTDWDAPVTLDYTGGTGQSCTSKFNDGQVSSCTTVCFYGGPGIVHRNVSNDGTGWCGTNVLLVDRELDGSPRIPFDTSCTRPNLPPYVSLPKLYSIYGIRIE